MKRFLSLILAVILVLGMCACAQKQEVQETTAKVTYTATDADIALLEGLYEGRTPFHGDLHNHSNSGGRSDGKVELRIWPTVVMEPKERPAIPR
jgi:hypothetical protein